METFAYLYAAVAYEAPDFVDGVSMESKTALPGLAWYPLPIQATTGVLAIACGLSILGTENKAFAFETLPQSTTIATIDDGILASGKVEQTTLMALQTGTGAANHTSSSSGENVSSSVLSRGDKGAAVVSLQNQLRRIGYFDGPVTGFFGRLTEAAVTKFQQDKGLAVDGQFGRHTEAALKGSTPVTSNPLPQGGPATTVPSL